jgi:hypothetical protein
VVVARAGVFASLVLSITRRGFMAVVFVGFRMGGAETIIAREGAIFRRVFAVGILRFAVGVFRFAMGIFRFAGGRGLTWAGATWAGWARLTAAGRSVAIIVIGLAATAATTTTTAATAALTATTTAAIAAAVPAALALVVAARALLRRLALTARSFLGRTLKFIFAVGRPRERFLIGIPIFLFVFVVHILRRMQRGVSRACALGGGNGFRFAWEVLARGQLHIARGDASEFG